MENFNTKSNEDEYNERNTRSNYRFIIFVVIGSIFITTKIILLVYVCIRHFKLAAEAKMNETQEKCTTNKNNIEKMDNSENNFLHKNTNTETEKNEGYSEENINQKDTKLLSLEHVDDTKIIEMLNKNTNGLKLSNITFHKDVQKFLGLTHKDNDFVHFNPCIDITFTSTKVVKQFLFLFGIHKNIWKKFVNARKEELRTQELYKTPTKNTFAVNFPGPNKVPPSILKRKGWWASIGKKKKLKFVDD